LTSIVHELISLGVEPQGMPNNLNEHFGGQSHHGFVVHSKFHNQKGTTVRVG
jgi:hypothetical protein